MAKIININEEIFTFEENAPKQASPIQYFIDENGCHICKSHALDKDKYPRVHRHGKDLHMNRYIWSLVHGIAVPKGMVVMHSCDNPQCINPEHLKLGTHQENMKEMREKGRSAHGSKHPKAKLNESKVYFIKFKSFDLTNKELAEMFNVAQDTIRDLKNGKTWGHITEDMKNLSSENNVAA